MIKENKKQQNKADLSPWFIFRVIIYLFNKILAIFLIYTLITCLFKLGLDNKTPNISEILKIIVFSILGVFITSSIFDLFVMGELNIKPITATASLEIKK